jgi:hypothetical protein
MKIAWPRFFAKSWVTALPKLANASLNTVEDYKPFFK